jgi:hypothetical protein
MQERQLVAEPPAQVLQGEEQALQAPVLSTNWPLLQERQLVTNELLQVWQDRWQGMHICELSSPYYPTPHLLVHKLSLK